MKREGSEERLNQESSVHQAGHVIKRAPVLSVLSRCRVVAEAKSTLVELTLGDLRESIMATIQPPTAEEEGADPSPVIASCVAVYSFADAIIHSRITNDEKVLKKVVKRFHTYASAAYPLHPPETQPEPAAIDEAKELFRVDLESFHLTLKKAVLVCEAERRQVEQYEREKQRIGAWPRRCTRPSWADATLPEDERESLKGQIEQLKTSLEDAQISRRQMVEYDLIAEKINQLPSRDELQQ